MGLWARFQSVIRKQSIALYRTVRHPRNRQKGRLRAWLRERIRHRGLWLPQKDAVAAGLGGGLFFAMLPIPLQSFVAAAVGIARGWNLPSAVAATWLSNPATYAPMILGAKFTVSHAGRLIGHDCAVNSLTLERLREILEAAKDFQLQAAWSMAGPAILEILLGMVLLGVILGVAGFLLVHLLWDRIMRPLSPRKQAEPGV